ncbi:MAG: nucleotidyl transferase AbiEii/AbiGii toxin family protein [Anaerolineales bacterium]|nr:nucleotidyl transferase AbiEii/AbiGii toxin family protein [Anaerolineales bacterium]
MNNPSYFYNRLYPLQDRVLALIHQLETGLYLSGGTAASRGYLNHRFSDDIDLFADDDKNFVLWAERVIHAISNAKKGELIVGLREERFFRLTLTHEDVVLKIEMINDVPSRVGQVYDHPILGRLDSAENILANKITALLDREEPKDLADIWGFCQQKGLSLEEAISGAQGKAAGVFPADLARVLCSATKADWEAVRWIRPPQVDEYLADLNVLGEKLLLA